MGILDALRTVALVGDTIHSVTDGIENVQDMAETNIGRAILTKRLVSRGIRAKVALDAAAAGGDADKPGKLGLLGVASDIILGDE